MLKMLKSPLVRSSIVLAILGGVAAWNFKSTADAECIGTCFPSKAVWVRYRNTICWDLNGSYILAAFPCNYSATHPPARVCVPFNSCVCLFQCAISINWEGKCTGHASQPSRECFVPEVCLGFFPPCRGCRLCPCSGCACLCVEPQKIWYNLSQLKALYTPSGCSLGWVKYNHGRCFKAT